MYQEKCLSTKLIKQSDWSMVSSNKHMNLGCVRPELDRSQNIKASKPCKIVVLIFFYMRDISMELLPEKSIQTSCRKISTGPFTNVPQFHTIIHQN